MKAIYTLLILLIPYIGIGQVYTVYINGMGQCETYQTEFMITNPEGETNSQCLSSVIAGSIGEYTEIISDITEQGYQLSHITYGFGQKSGAWAGYYAYSGILDEDEKYVKGTLFIFSQP